MFWGIRFGSCNRYRSICASAGSSKTRIHGGTDGREFARHPGASGVLPVPDGLIRREKTHNTLGSG